MGTNYYIEGVTCPLCNHTDDRIHIGKSSVGWRFLLHKQPGLFTNYIELVKYLENGMVEIRDEYGRTVPLWEFMTMINNKKDMAMHEDEAPWVGSTFHYLHDGPVDITDREIS